jgi:hypothetical protein
MAASDDSDDIEIRLTHDDENMLRAPALDLLEELKLEYSAELYTQASQYLTGPTFRWVFVSDTQPHRYLLRAFREHVPKGIRDMITRVYLPHVTARGYTRPSAGYHNIDLNIPHSWNYDHYFIRIDPVRKGDWSHIMRAIRKDIGFGITLLAHVLPSIKRLDIGLDVLDCVPSLSYHIRMLGPGWPNTENGGPLLEQMIPLKNLKTIGDIDVRICWDDFFQQDRIPDTPLARDTDTDWQRRFMDKLVKHIPANSIIGHSKD